MRLLDVRTYELREFHDDNGIPPYAILSHTWREEGESELNDVRELGKWSLKPWTAARVTHGKYRKISAASHLARQDGLRWIWIDTCCIDRSNLVEVQEAVNSSFRWYQDAAICYVYLQDLSGRCPVLDDTMLDGTSQSASCAPWIGSFSRCAWFSRGWTLSELLAPRKIRFLNKVWKPVGIKAMLVRIIARRTGIDAAIIRQRRALSSVSVAARLSWAAQRKTRRVEDQAYCLLGLFGISMPILYGEGPRAFHRLQEVLINASGDLSIFAWSSSQTDEGLLADSPGNFADCGRIILSGTGAACEIRNGRLKATLPLTRQKRGHSDVIAAVLGCRDMTDVDHGLALRLQRCHGSKGLFFVANEKSEAVESKGRLTLVNLETLKSAEIRTIELVARRDLQISPGVKFIVKTEYAGTPMPAIKIVSVQPSDLWNASAQVLLPSEEPHLRALLHVRLPSGRDLALEAGYDESVVLDDSGRTFRKHLIPGLRILFVGRGWDDESPSWACKSPYFYCEHKNGCLDASAVTTGCPNTPVVAEIGVPRDPEVVKIELIPETPMGEELFVLKMTVTRASTIGSKESSRPSTGNTDQSALLPPYSPPRRDPPSYRYFTDAIADTGAGSKLQVPRRSTQQQILLSNPSGKLWKLYPEGLLEVAEKQKLEPATWEAREPVPRKSVSPRKGVQPRKDSRQPARNPIRKAAHSESQNTGGNRQRKARSQPKAPLPQASRSRSSKQAREEPRKKHEEMIKQSDRQHSGVQQGVKQPGMKQPGGTQSHRKQPPSQAWLSMSAPLHILYR